ncbi:hypothetical protein KJ980_07180 [Patescibacteria group bacterium]|nr:hypothetical protein [Patescibacteria group bacterium]MBU4016973.1 hypothetical protein [Patescibacteria group bacterium]MBU4099404.1 hypothetical protein [Patescibacteria group bacterium]
MNTLCPVCGFNLGFPAWKGYSASHETCLSCGIEFGYHDVMEASGIIGTKEEIYMMWRKKWIEKGMPWSVSEAYKPTNWNPKKQLKNIGIEI